MAKMVVKRVGNNLGGGNPWGSHDANVHYWEDSKMHHWRTHMRHANEEALEGSYMNELKEGIQAKVVLHSSGYLGTLMKQVQRVEKSSIGGRGRCAYEELVWPFNMRIYGEAVLSWISMNVMKRFRKRFYSSSLASQIVVAKKLTAMRFVFAYGGPLAKLGSIPSSVWCGVAVPTLTTAPLFFLLHFSALPQPHVAFNSPKPNIIIKISYPTEIR
ncbi:unnamed protein product [Sphenostylis stenocarpa]|uniref:Uncharacterized protein n=1 Tax=Sphenostylis stenocarpa TaxID=92480 RepID=A0AA86SKH8_9FABA|nr:unnamed protein product [Sphenostylis stenocarpa]